MTPKEKAKKLVGQFPMNGLVLKYGDAPKQYIEHNKQCALIAVDEVILEQCKSSEKKDARYQDERLMYWYEVREEIKKI